MKGIFKFLFIAALFITGCGDSFNQAENYLTGPVNGVGLKSATSVVSGGTEQLFPVVSPPRTSNKKVTWTSSDSSIVSVDSNGVITGVATPAHEETKQAIITVTTDEGGYTAQCTVTVSEKPVAVTGITISQSTLTLHVGNQGNLTATITPTDATNQNLTWKSSNSKVIVDGSGLVMAVAAGTAIVTVSTVDGGYKASCTVTSTADTVYTVTYNGNGATGGSAPVDTNTYLENDKVTVKDSGGLDKTSNTFAGWNRNSDGSGTTYAVGSTLTMETSDVTFYAMWTPDATLPPTDLSYPTLSAVYTQNSAITDNVPIVTGTVTLWSINPALPAGLSFDTATGIISGTPTAVQTSTLYTVTATNAGGFATTHIMITVNYAAPSGLSYSTPAAVYSAGAIITDNVPAVTGTVTSWSISPSLPSWLVIDTSTGVISGIAANVQSQTTYTVTASNSGGSTTAVITISVVVYTVGSTGPAGGLVFYDRGYYYSDGNGYWRYLEAAPANQSNCAWSNISGTLIGSTGTAVGTGKTNTAAIIGQSGHTESAALVCENYSYGGYTDWFLPSLDELHLMYTNLKQNGLGGFTSDFYWCSSEYLTYSTMAWEEWFTTSGGQYNSSKSNARYVRAIRAF